MALALEASGGNTELYDAGEAFLRRALDLEPAATTARAYLAVLLNRTGRAEEAATECERKAVLSSDSDIARLYEKLALRWREFADEIEANALATE